MKRIRWQLSGFALVLALPAWGAVTAADVLSRMDRSAAQFRNMTADLTRVEHTAVLNENSEDKGKIYLKRGSLKDVRFRIDFTSPETKAVSYQERKVQVFLPNINTVQVYNFSKQSSLVDQYLALLLGFGTPGTELAKSYVVTVVGEETLRGTKTIHLLLTPKMKDDKVQLKQVEIWLDAAQSYPIEQKVVRQSGDYWVFRYDHVALNPGLGDDQLKLNLPKGVKVEYPQK